MKRDISELIVTNEGKAVVGARGCPRDASLFCVWTCAGPAAEPEICPYFKHAVGSGITCTYEEVEGE